jgi:hypothetical protein
VQVSTSVSLISCTAGHLPGRLLLEAGVALEGGVTRNRGGVSHNHRLQYGELFLLHFPAR